MTKREVVKTLLLSPLYLAMPLNQRLILVRFVLRNILRIAPAAIVLFMAVPAFADEVSTVTWGSDIIGEVHWDKGLIITMGYASATESDQKLVAMAKALQNVEIIFLGVCKADLPSNCESMVCYIRDRKGGLKAIARVPIPPQAMIRRMQYMRRMR